MKNMIYENYGIKPHLEYPKSSIYQVVYETSKKYPNNISYNYFNKEVTYEEFIKQINEVCKSFKKIGIKKGDKVAVSLPNTPEIMISIYALNKIGAVIVSIHPLSSKNEFKDYLNITDSKVLLIIDSAFKNCKDIISQTQVKKTIVNSINKSIDLDSKSDDINLSNYENTIFWEEFIKIGKNYDGNIDVEVEADDPAFIMFSSGTTGKPKAILLSNLNFNSNVRQQIEMFKITDKDSMFTVMPMFHAFGFVSLHIPQSIGAKNILIPAFHHKKFYQYLKEYKPTMILSVPTLLKTMMEDEKIKNMDLSFLNIVLSGGDFVEGDMKRDFDKFLKEQNTSIQLIAGYGLTESSSGITQTPQNHYKEGTVGIPNPDSYLKIVKPDSIEELPTGETGEICINSPAVMLGYLNEEETKNTLKLHDDGKKWLHTGDLGFVDDEGWLFFKSRIKNVIISNGYTIYSNQIEKVLNNNEYISESVVVGIPHPHKRKVVKAFIVLKEGIKESEELKNNIHNYCKDNVSKFAIPYEYEFVNELPRTKLGKIDYKKLNKS